MIGGYVRGVSSGFMRREKRRRTRTIRHSSIAAKTDPTRRLLRFLAA
jgi:hypothetical protein